MSEPRFPPITRHIIEELPQRFSMWFAPFIVRLTDLFRQMRPAEGWAVMSQSVWSASHSATTPPTWAQIISSTWGWRYSATSANNSWVSFVLPRDISFTIDKEDGTAGPVTLYPEIKWISEGTDTGDLRLGMTYAFAKEGDVFSETTIYSLVTSSGVANEVQVAKFAAIESEDLEPESVLMVRFFRDAAAGADTLTDDVFLLSVDMIYYSDGLLTNERIPSSTDPRYTKRPQFAP